VGRRTLLGVLVLVGAALRLTGVDGFLINPDEAMFLQTANREHLNDVFGTSLFHAHPPASYYIYHAVGLATRDIFWLRMPPFLAGVAMIGLAWWLGREVAGARGGLALAWLVTFSPGLIELSSVCRNYTFAFAFLLAALAGMARFVAGGRWRDYALFVGGFMADRGKLFGWAVAGLMAAHGVMASVETVRLAGRQELPAREDEFNRAIATLESRFQPGDFVLLDEQSALVASFHLPELSAWYWETVPRQYERNGVLYCYIPHTNWYFKPQHLVTAAERAIAEFGLPRTGTLWVLHASWEEQGDLRQRVEKRLPVIHFPETGFVPSVRRGSRPLLLAIRAQEIATIREAFPEWAHRHQ